jgi:hypothetical protein
VAVVVEDEEEARGKHAATVVICHDRRVLVDAEPPEHGLRRRGSNRQALDVGRRVVEIVRVEQGSPGHVADPVGDAPSHPTSHVDDADSRRAHHARELFGLDEELGVGVLAPGQPPRGDADGRQGQRGEEESAAGRNNARHRSLRPCQCPGEPVSVYHPSPG